MKNKIISVILIIIIMIVPMSIIKDKFNDYNLIRSWILIAGGGILLILLILNYKQFKIDNKDFFILGFMVLIFISTLNSSQIRISIFGTSYRYEGMLSLYTYILIYFCAKKFLKFKNPKRLLIILQILYIIIGSVGIVQNFLDVANPKWRLLFHKTVCGTFGNSNFMGNFMSMGIPLFIITYILYRNRLSFIASAVTFFCLIACYARSGWVAFAFFCILLAIYLIKNRKKEYLKRTFILVITFVAIFYGLYYQKNGVVKSKISVIKDDFKMFQKAMDETDEEIEENRKIATRHLGSGRFTIWKIVLELIEKYPLLGVGTDNLKYGIYENLSDTAYEYIMANQAFPDKAHNEYLQIAVTLGIPALILYMIFLCLIVFPKLKYMLTDKKIFILLGVILSYLCQALFNISTIGIAPLFWFALGVIDNENIMK